MPPVVVREDIEPGIVCIRMQDKVYKNTFTEQFIVELVQAFQSVEYDTECKVVILTGYDSYFSSGGSKEALLAIFDKQAQFTDSNLYSLALECKVPVIAAMQGHGIGGGFILGISADIVILSRESVYTTNFMNYGFTPGMGATYLLPKKLGFSLAEEMLLNADTFRGAELEKRGVPFAVLPREEVMDHAMVLARQVAEKPKGALVTLKGHMVGPLRRELSIAVQQEVDMHMKTFHQAEVKERIISRFGQ